MNITDTMLDRWEQVTERASEGPWLVDSTGPDTVYPGIDGPNGPIAIYGCEEDNSGIVSFDDADFMCNARVAMPLLIEEVRDLRIRLEMAEMVRENVA